MLILVLGLMTLVGCSTDNESEMVKYTLTVNVTDEATGNAIEGATVEVDGTEKTTDANGLAQFELGSYNDYTVNISADAYQDNSVSATMKSADSSIDVALSETSAAVALYNSNTTEFNEFPTNALNGVSYSVATDEYTEGDSSVKVSFPGGAWGGIFVGENSSDPATVDLSSYQGGNLVFDIKLPDNIADVGVKLEGPKGTGSELAISSYTGTDAGNGWMTYTIPLADFGADLSQMIAGFGLWNATDSGDNFVSGDIYVDNVRFEESQNTDSKSYLYSSTETVDLVEGEDYDSIAEPGWDSGSALVTLDNTSDATYSPVMEWSMGSGWGGPAIACGFNGFTAGDLSAYSTLGLKFKYTNTTDGAKNIEVQIEGADTQSNTYYATDDAWTDLDNGWAEVNVPLADYGSLASATRIVLIVKDDASNPVYFTDIYLE